jgi:hypothetical protein
MMWAVLRRALPTVVLSALGVAVLALTWATVRTSRGWPDGLHAHLGLYVAAGAAWAIAALLVPRLAEGRGQLAIVVGVALLLRLPAWLAPPAHSDDVYRFLWEGRVQRAGQDPYLHAPDAPELAPLRDEAWTHVNNRQLTTVYPPGAELLFRLGASLPGAPLAAWKAIVAAFDLGLLALLIVWLRRRGADVRRALVWGWSPLVAIELAQNAHLDGIGAALLAGALFAWELDRRAGELAAGALLALSAAVKLFAIVLLPSLRRARVLIAFVVALAVVSAPYLRNGTHLRGSLGEYGRRWRGNDGAFALLHAAAGAAVEHTRFRARQNLSDSPRLARLVTGRERDQVYPDEVANLAARLAAGALFLLVLALALARRLPPARVAAVALGAFLLLSPTLHPWYVVWMVPLAATGASPAWLVLAALVPLGYWPLAGYLEGGGWHDPVWTRALEHGATLALLAIGAFQRTIDPSARSSKI